MSAYFLKHHQNGHYPKRVLVLDNARFHHGGDLKQIAELYNIELTYLPPYSPELKVVGSHQAKGSFNAKQF